MTLPFRAAQASEWTGGALLQGDPEACFSGACIDSRTLRAGDLFVAIVGPRHDAHAFVEQVVRAGAGGLLVARGRPLPERLPADLPVLAVDDTTRALGALARGHRKGFSGPVVAITGSNGKTTTKEMCAAILSVAAPCLKNRGNLNNEFGLPLTLLDRDAAHRSIVVELGMNHRGEIAALAAIARPTVGILTNIGTAHIEYLGSREEIAREKGDLLASLPPDGVAVLAADDPRAMAQAGRTRARVLRFGLGNAADVRAERVRSRRAGGCAFELVAPEGRTRVAVRGLGETAVRNALAAAAGALAAGAPLADLAPGLASYEPVSGRLTPRALAGDVVVIDDTYNANPQSMELALRTLAGLDRKGRAIAVLGEMGELGEAADEAHREVGRLAARLQLDRLFALGDHARQLVAAAVDAGMDPERALACDDAEDLAARVLAAVGDGDRVLVKGSRSMRMERVVERLARERS